MYISTYLDVINTEEMNTIVKIEDACHFKVINDLNVMKANEV